MLGQSRDGRRTHARTGNFFVLRPETFRRSNPQIRRYQIHLRAALLEHLAGQVVHDPDLVGVLGAEDRRDYPVHAPAETPAPGLPCAVAHEVDDAALPGRALEDLPDGPPEPLVGVGGDERHAGDAAAPDGLEEPSPGVVGLRVNGGDAQDVPPAVLVAADGRNHRRGRHAALPPALHVGRVEPEVGDAGHGEVAREQLLHVGVQVPGYRAHLVLGQSVGAHLPGHPLDLARARSRGARLGDRRHERPVHPLVARQHVVGEEAADPELRDPGRERPHAGHELALPVAVPAVALAAHLVGLGVHDLVHDALRELAQQLLHVGRAVLEPRHRRAVQGRRERRI